MTAVLPPPALPAADPEPGHRVRVSVLTPRGRADLALPADVVLAELVPMVRELVGRAGTTGVPQAWRFSGSGGGPLPPDRTLDELRVHDGELLHLGPARPVPAPPVLDDAAEAVAHTVREAGEGSGAAGWAGPAAAVLGTTGACAVLSTVDGPLRLAAVATAAAGALIALVVARRCTASGGAADARTATGAALCAVPAAATAGLLALPAPAGAGALLLAAAGAGCAAAAGQAIARAVSPVLLAVAMACTGTALAALARLLLDAPVGAVAAGLAAPALAAGPLLPRLALRLAGIPAPDVPADAGGLPGAEQVLPGDVLAARARLARGLHSGTLAGTAVPAVGGAAVAAATGGWTGAVLLAVTATVLLLRARALVEPVPARVLAGTAVVAVVSVAVPVALTVEAPVRIGVAAGLLLAVAAGAATARARPSPPTRRALDVLELVLTAAAIPAALAAMGLFGLVRGL
ncbi:type VII secretion integral membrane protein EccD [Pseudonocardia parietis]|uniref:Type VII secretion integral membrane protein EccD n=1 Tax=Pseudonocardia parietis TaxID=570936 RepID=A0ABS4VPH9_9PSEU|nr:type VII secretion integral membrane protein EccD [Pseudonocardia parietis]MBP2365825.1 type VII secretion integral membrane protein EccD [Pseudonocardia parietis]